MQHTIYNIQNTNNNQKINRYESGRVESRKQVEVSPLTADANLLINDNDRKQIAPLTTDAKLSIDDNGNDESNNQGLIVITNNQ